MLQGVHELINIEPDRPWAEGETRHTTLVAIGGTSSGRRGGGQQVEAARRPPLLEVAWDGHPTPDTWSARPHPGGFRSVMLRGLVVPAVFCGVLALVTSGQWARRRRMESVTRRPVAARADGCYSGPTDL